VIIPWITIIWQINEIKILNHWPIPIICLGLTCIPFIMMQSKVSHKIFALPSFQKYLTPINLVGKFIGNLFQFNWFFTLLWWLYDLIARPIQFFVRILEGEGGLLWALVFLALISSVLVGKVLP
jgi:hypothetical protein